MAGLGDMARVFAAGGEGGMAGDAGAPDMEASDPNAPSDMAMGTDDPSAMIEQGITMIEGALDSLPGELAEKARQLVEGLKEIAAQGAAAGTPDDLSAESPDGSAGGLESASEPKVGGSAEGFGA